MNPKDLLARIGSVTIAAAALVIGSAIPGSATPPDTEPAVIQTQRPGITLAKLVLAPANETNGDALRFGHGSHRSHSSHSSHYSHRSGSGSSGGGGTVAPSPAPVEKEPVLPAAPEEQPWTIHEAAPPSPASPVEKKARIETRSKADKAKFQKSLDLIDANDIGPIRHMVDKDKWLLKAADAKGRTLLHYAAQHTRPEIVSMLLERQADVNARSDDHSTPVNLVPMTAEMGDREYGTLEALIKGGANVNGGAKVPPIVRCLLLIAGTGDKDLETDRSASEAAQPLKKTISLLVKHGADVDASDIHGNTLLLAAIERNLSSLAIELISEGADIHSVNGEFENALHIIARAKTTSFEALADLLLKKGIAVNAEDKSGRTALDVAIKFDNQTFATYLRQHGGKE